MYDSLFGKRSKAAGIGFALWFVFCALVSLATTGFLLYLLYLVVTWVISK